MSVSYIVLGVIAVILIYILYLYFSSNVSTLATVIDCSKGSTYIDGSKLSGASSANFGYGIWVYISNWSTKTTGITNIFYRSGSNASSNTIHVFMDNNSPSLYVQFSNPTEGAAYTKKGTSSTNGTGYDNQAVLVTSTMPLQKWVYIFVSVDGGTYVDIYLDGKMVKTNVLTNATSGQAAPSGTTAIPGIVVGPFFGYVTTFQSFGYAVDPQTVWTYYMKGNGNALGTSYGMDVGILKNDEVTAKYRVF